MRAMILAAGLGTRLRPLTLKTPKPLITVAGKPLIVHHIENLKRAGIKDIVINHSWLGEQIVAMLGDGQQWGINIHYSPEPEPLETGGGILNALPLLTEGVTDSAFMVINGDIFTDYPLQSLPSKISGLAHLVLVDNPPFKIKGDFSLAGTIVQKDDSVLLTFSGISILSGKLFQRFSQTSFPLVSLLQKAITKGAVSGEYYCGQWTDVGTVDRLNALEKKLHKLSI